MVGPLHHRRDRKRGYGVTEERFLDRVRVELEHWLRRDWTFGDVGDHWDATEDYDDINEETYSYFRRFTDGLRLSDLSPRGRVLDFCARTGIGTAYFYEHGRIGEAVCADVSLQMGRICIRRLQEAGVERWLWIPVANYRLPFADGYFDSILCFETVEHFPQPARLVSELGRVTRPGGELILTTPNVLWEPVHALAAILKLHHSEGPHRFVPYRQLRAMVERAGFVAKEQETTVLVPGGPEWLIRFGEWLEERTRRSLMPLLGLRRVIVARRVEGQ